MSDAFDDLQLFPKASLSFPPRLPDQNPTNKIEAFD